MAKYGPRRGGPAALIADDLQQKIVALQQMGSVVKHLLAERDALLTALVNVTGRSVKDIYADFSEPRS